MTSMDKNNFKRGVTAGCIENISIPVLNAKKIKPCGRKQY